MTCVGIDVAKDKHDCCIVNSDGEILANVFTISNDQIGFNLLFQTGLVWKCGVVIASIYIPVDSRFQAIPA